MKIRTRYPKFQAWQNTEQQIPSMVKKLRRALSHNIKNLSPRDVFEIGVALYETDMKGPGYQQIRDKWKGSPVFQRIQKKAKDQQVRESLAEIAAFHATVSCIGPHVSAAATCVDTALAGINKHLPPGNEAKTLVVGAGNVGCEWLSPWRKQLPLTLIDNNPYLADFLENCAASFQRTNAIILEGDVFDLPDQGKVYNVIHAGNFLHYLPGDRITAFFLKLLPRLFPASKVERLLILQEAADRSNPVWQKDFNPFIRAAGLGVVGASTRRISQHAILTMFVK
jgi:hypothetical protein